MRYLSNIIFFITFLLLSSDTATSYAIPKAERRKYRLVFRDEFADSLDTTHWSVPKRQKYMWSRQISTSPYVYNVKNGKLACKAVPNTMEHGDTARMLTCAFSTQGKFEFQYGKIRVRLRTNSMEGNFPAVWLLPAEKVNAPFRYGEIDLFETFGNDGKAHQTVHNHRTFSLGKKENNAFPHSIDVTKWHIYEVEWTPSYIMFSIDGKTTGYYMKSEDSSMLSEGQWTFDRPYYIIINQSTGQKGWHEPDYNQVYETEIDWIRVYQQTNTIH